MQLIDAKHTSNDLFSTDNTSSWVCQRMALSGNKSSAFLLNKLKHSVVKGNTLRWNWCMYMGKSFNQN